MTRPLQLSFGIFKEGASKNSNFKDITSSRKIVLNSDLEHCKTSIFRWHEGNKFKFGKKIFGNKEGNIVYVVLPLRAVKDIEGNLSPFYSPVLWIFQLKSKPREMSRNFWN